MSLPSIAAPANRIGAGRWVRGFVVVAAITASISWAGSGVGAAAPSETLTAALSRWPVRGPIISDFGTRRSFWTRGGVHTGIDIGAARGTPIHAPLSGTVAFAGWRNGYGATVILDHGRDVRTLYGHLSKLGVRRGQRVEHGAPIGLTGTTGRASGPHLHYEILVKGRPVNPRGYLVRSGGAARYGPRRAARR